MVQAEAAERFLSTPWLAGHSDATIRAVFDALIEAHAPAGTLLLTQGQPNDHLSFLIGGTASIERTKGAGPPETLASIAAPSLFGSTSFFTLDSPTFAVRARTDVWLLTLYHPEHDRLRRDNPTAAEAVAVAVVHVLSQRLDELDRTFSDYMARHPHDVPKVNEWAGFRARLFEEPSD